MSKQAIQLAELFKHLPLAEKLLLMELMLREVKEQALKKDTKVENNRKAGFSKATFEMSEDFNESLELVNERRRKAAELLLADYQHDEELTAFTLLDGDDLYETK
ncbi:MAG: hypothetical protein EPO28_03715 [Saprospiraceae bacterium]|nr:MAG: hypothetical protein EPO28_03715 [Saprospiraceae bacterium]